jgi:hypothetical protein
MSTPVVDSNSEILTGLYTMFYRDPGRGNHIQSKNFRFHGTLREAIQRSQKHCDNMGFKLMFTQPMVNNLDKDEEDKLGNLDMSKLEADRKAHEMRVSTAFGHKLEAK